MRPHHPTLPAALFGLMLIATTVSAEGQTFRWVNESGDIQLSDTLPSGAAARGYQVIDPHTGEVIRDVSPRKSAAEKAREANERQAAKRAEREARTQAERDRILLSLYGSEADLQQARDERLDRMDARIRQMEGSIERMRANIEDGHADPQYARDLERLEQALAEAREEKKAVTSEFDTDLERLRQLKSND
ncbi:MAG: hypothetical protein ACLFO0_04705 [Guyparkeria sp.]